MTRFNTPLAAGICALLLALLAGCGDSSSLPGGVAGAGSSSGSNPGSSSGTGSSSGGIPALCPLPARPAGQTVETPCSERADPRLAAMSDTGIALTSALGLPPGRYALPATAAPTQLVVMFHGHQNDSCSWRNHLRKVAERGGIAVAMDYAGQSDRVIDPYGKVENWGWAVRSGAADSIIAARYFLERYPSLKTVYSFGASMGGNVSGFALYSPDAKRADCSALFDYWVATEGVHNLTEEYTGTRALARVLVAADQAQREIEEENGGPLEAVPAKYTEITNVANASKLAYLKGVVFTHGTTDQTVPFDQSRQMTDQLRAAGVPVSFFPVVPSDHVWEGTETLKVMTVGLDELFRLMAGGTVSNGETPVAGP